LSGEFDQAADLSVAPQLGPVFELLFVLHRIAEGLGIAAALGHSRLAKPEGYHCPPLTDILSKLADAGLELTVTR
jgi:hypothetical protein